MKASKVLAVVLTLAALPGCVSKEKPVEPVGAAPRAAAEAPPDQAIVVAQLLEAHQEAIGQIRVASTLRPQPKAECN